MDISKIRKLIKLVNASDITEIEVVEGSHSVRISRASSPLAVATAPAAPTPQIEVPVTMASSSPTAAEIAEPATKLTDSVNEEHLVNSPMVGTFYRAASPESQPFVREGDYVNKGDTLCIIEAMKLMNEIEAEYSGTVRKIILENATPVEYGQAMFEITPS